MTHRPDSDHLHEFVAGFLAGNPVHVRLIQSRLTRYIQQRFTSGSDEREDLVAEILSILLSSLRRKQFHGEDLKSFNAYLYGIARLKIMQTVERNGRRENIAKHIVSGDLPVRHATDPEARALNSEFLKRIYQDLSESCREMIRMKFIDGWSDQEIADYRRMSKNAVSTALTRCLQKARELSIVKEILYQGRG